MRRQSTVVLCSPFKERKDLLRLHYHMLAGAADLAGTSELVQAARPFAADISLLTAGLVDIPGVSRLLSLNPTHQSASLHSNAQVGKHGISGICSSCS